MGMDSEQRARADQMSEENQSSSAMTGCFTPEGACFTGEAACLAPESCFSYGHLEFVKRYYPDTVATCVSSGDAQF